MLRYINSNYNEFTKLVKIAQKGESDVDVVKMFTAVKGAGNVIETDQIYPCPATRLHFETNHDHDKNIIREEHMNEGYPVLDPTAEEYEELAMSVEVYPPMAGWKLEASENMELPSSLVDTIQYGCQTVVIPVVPQQKVGNERRWIRLVPADENSVAEPTTFIFYVKKAAQATVVSTAWAHWSFDTDTPMVDKRSGILLSDPTNLTSPSVHITSTGAVKNALRGTDINGGAAAIIVNDTLYVRDNTYDTSSMYGWKSATSETAYRTQTSSPSAGEALYDTSDVLVEGATVSSLTATHDNYWSTPDLGVDLSGTSQESFSMSMFTRRWSGSAGKAGIFDFNNNGAGSFSIAWAYDNVYIGIPDNTSGISFEQVPALRLAKTNSNNFKHTAVSISKVYSLENDPYDPETGIGVSVSWECAIRYKGATYNAYTRSPNDDSNERYAYKTTNVDAIAAGVEIVWADEENPHWQNYRLSPDGEYETTKINGLDPLIFRQHGTTTFKYASLDLTVSVRRENKSNLSDLVTSWRYYKIYVNGERVAVRAYGVNSSLAANYTHFRIDMQSTNHTCYASTNDTPMIDEIKLWKRELTDSEMINEAINGGVYHVSEGGNKGPKSTENSVQHIKPYKITVADSANVYYRDPNIDGLVNDSLDTPRYGWKRMSGTGPEQLWTANIVPATTNPCFLEKYANSASMDHRVLSVTELSKSDINYAGLLHMQVYILDKQTLAVAVSFHDLIQDRLNEEYPFYTLRDYNAVQGYEAGWSAAWGKNGIIWYVMAAYDPYLVSVMDTDSNWYFDGDNNHELLGRWFGSSGYFRTNRRQYHNVDKGSAWYIEAEDINLAANQPPIDGIQYAYIKLATPMEEGSTHTLSLLGNNVTFTFAADDSDSTSGSIKINQEGYLPWQVTRYAYLGQFMGSYGAFNPYLKMTVSDGTNTSVYVKNYKDDVYDGKNTKFAWNKESGTAGPDTVYTKGPAPTLNGNVYTSVESNTVDASLTVTSVPTFSLTTVPIKYGRGVDSLLVNHLDRQHIAYTNSIIQVSAYKQTASGSGLRASDVYPYGYSGSKQSTDGECTYECDFTNFSSCTKDKIVVDGVSYFRDVIEDYVYFELTIGGAQYVRDNSKDTCNCYAWVRKTAGSVPDLLYTRTDTDVSGRLMLSIPQADDVASDTYEDGGNEYVITNVTTPVLMQGWTTERATEQDWGDYTTIWTDSTVFYPENSTTFEIGSEPTAIDKSGETLLIFSYTKDAECNDISGYYAIHIADVGWSYPFPIHVDAIGHMFWMYCHGMFNQRSGSTYHKRPYTNWEFQAAYPAYCHKGIYMLDDEATSRITVCWRVDPVTHQDILNESASRIGIADHFSENNKNDQIDTPVCRDLKGGWWDAADYDMRSYHLRAVDDFAKTFLYFPENFCDNQLNIPESGDGIPDILNEAMWGIEVYRRSQQPDGGICGWFEASGHESGTPDECVKNGNGNIYYSCIPTRYASAMYATPAFHLARGLWYVAQHANNTELKAKANALGDMYFESAAAAFAFAVKDIDPVTLEFIKPQQPIVYSIGTKAVKYLEPYDNDVVGNSKTSRQQEYITAAAAMYAITREDFPKSFLTLENTTNHINNRYNGEAFCKISWDLCIDCDDIPEVSTPYKQRVIRIADEFAAAGPTTNAYRGITRCPETDYWFRAAGWGHIHPDYRGPIFPLAWRITKDSKYRNVIINGMNFVTGCNCYGMSWTTGLGKVYPVRNMSHFGGRIHRNEIFSTDPGITQYLYSELNGIKWAPVKYSIGLSPDARKDIGFEGVSFSRTPAKMLELGSTKPVCEAGPCWRYIAFMQEAESVEMSEYTIWETMCGKVNLTGLLLSKNWKPRSWYKQCRPAKSLFEDRCYVFLV